MLQVMLLLHNLIHQLIYQNILNLQQQFHKILGLNKFDLNISSNILSFDKLLSILNAKIASFSFLCKLTSLVKRKFLATCCVIVDAPSSLFEFNNI